MGIERFGKLAAWPGKEQRKSNWGCDQERRYEGMVCYRDGKDVNYEVWTKALTSPKSLTSSPFHQSLREASDSTALGTEPRVLSTGLAYHPGAPQDLFPVLIWWSALWLQQWFKQAKEFVTDFSAISMVLILEACQMWELWDHSGFHQDLKECQAEICCRLRTPAANFCMCFCHMSCSPHQSQTNASPYP